MGKNSRNESFDADKRLLRADADNLSGCESQRPKSAGAREIERVVRPVTDIEHVVTPVTDCDACLRD
jgi:hypothetical protein